MKKYLPLMIACVTLVLAFVMSFAITRSIRLKKLRAAYLPTNPVSASDTADSTEGDAESTEKTTKGGKENAETPAALTKLPEPEIETMSEGSKWCLVLLNVYHKMNEDYEPVVVKVSEEADIYLDERVAEAYKSMAQAAVKDGITLSLDAGFITVEKQERMFNKEVDSNMGKGMSRDEAEATAAYTVLPPRCNEANYGLSVDFSWTGKDFTETDAYVWLRAHAAEYGFIERYTADKENVTRFRASPWHWRYVGTDAAPYMRDYNVTLEEFVGKVN